MDELNYFVRDKNIPQHLTIKLRTFFQNTQHVIFARAYDDLLKKMSPLLRGEAALKVAAQSIGRLPYFNAHQVESGFLATAALKLKTSIFSLREYVPIHQLVIIERGFAARDGRLKIKGTCLGHDMILELPHLRDWSPAIALTVVLQVMTLSREDLVDVLLESPRATEMVRRAAFKLAFQRVVLRVATEYRLELAAIEAKEGAASKKVDFLRLAMPTALARAHERAQSESVAINNFGSPAFQRPLDESGALDARVEGPSPIDLLKREDANRRQEARQRWGKAARSITAFRKRPALQDAVERLVDVDADNAVTWSPSTPAYLNHLRKSKEPVRYATSKQVEDLAAKLDTIVSSLEAIGMKVAGEGASPLPRGIVQKARRRRVAQPTKEGESSNPTLGERSCQNGGGIGSSGSNANVNTTGDIGNNSHRGDDEQWELKSRGPKLFKEKPSSSSLNA